MCKHNYDSYCGLYCGACDILVADKTGHKGQFAHFWNKSVLRKFLNIQEIGYTEEDLEFKCNGCKSDEVFINCRPCAMRNCAKMKGVEHCTECSDYPCKTWLLLKKGEKVLKHLGDKQSNLKTIKEKGVDFWLAEQEKRWQCPECGTNFAWYSTHCRNCGKKIGENAFKFTWVNALLFKMGFRYGSRDLNKKS